MIAEVFHMNNATFYKLFPTDMKPDEIASLSIPSPDAGVFS
jgi:hypothetical protein